VPNAARSNLLSCTSADSQSRSRYARSSDRHRSIAPAITTTVLFLLARVRHRRDCYPPLHLASGSPSNLRRIYVIQGFRWNDEIAEICASGCDRCRYSREMRALIQLRLNRRVWIRCSPWKDRSMIDSEIALCSAVYLPRNARCAR